MIDWTELQRLYAEWAQTASSLENTELWCRSVGLDPAATMRLTGQMIRDVAMVPGIDENRYPPALAHGSFMFGVFVGTELKKGRVILP